jgi:protein-tyrosine phosphatase
MKVLFVCTDNFTRSVIAEFCLRDYLIKNNITSLTVSSSGIRADSDISKYSRIHFEIMEGMGIDTSMFKRTMFRKDFFETFDVIIGMSDLHRDHIKEQYGREIKLFNEIYDGSSKPVNIGAPDSEDFYDQMKGLIEYFNNAMPQLLKNLQT